MDTMENIYSKAVLVVTSCKTLNQLKIAENFVSIAIKNIKKLEISYTKLLIIRNSLDTYIIITRLRIENKLCGCIKEKR